MPELYEIRWLPDGPIQSLVGSRGNHYELPNGEQLDLQSAPVWCHRCGKITLGEYLSSVEEISQQIRDLHDPSSELYGLLFLPGVFEEPIEEVNARRKWHIAELRRRLQWREGRRSPAKCIFCGTTELIVLPEGTPIAIPGHPGEFQIDCVGMCSTEFNEWIFTPEGDRIPRNTRPTYWHHPELDSPEGRQLWKEWLESLTADEDSDGDSCMS
jgi:hypothetical protein